jgi:hypothetical protein
MKKLLAMVLVLGLASVASAGLTFTPQIEGMVGDSYGDDAGEVAGTAIAVDILASETVAGRYLKSTGELAVVCTGGVTINSVAGLTYKGEGDGVAFWDPGVGLIVNSAADDAQNARVSAATVQLMTMFMLPLDDLCIEDILVDWDGTDGSVAIVPNNGPNPWGNAGWFDGSVAGDDLQAGGGTIPFVPEPITLSLLALGGLGVIRRRR